MHEIIFYRDRSGNEPVLDYLQELSEISGKDNRIKLNKINDYIQALSVHGTQLSENYLILSKGAIYMANISSVGHTWDEVRSKIFTPEEMAESDLRVALIGELIKARQERGITQRELEAMSGVKQPIIARMENGKTTPNLSTVLKVLAPLGKTLYIGDLPKNR